MSPGPQSHPDPAQDRLAFHQALHRKAERVALWLIIPAACAAYLANALAHPCWQTWTLFCGAVAMSAAWVQGFGRARRGEVQAAVLRVVAAGLAFGTLVMLLREDSALAITATFLALTAYVSLFSSRFLYVTSAVSVVAIVGSEVLGTAGLLPRFAMGQGGLVGLKVVFVSLFWAVATYFLRQAQIINEGVISRLDASRRVQQATLQAVGESQPKVAGVVSEVKQIADQLASQAAEHAATSRQVSLTAQTLAQTVSESAQEAGTARRITEETRRGAAAGGQSLRRVEAGFREAVRVLEGVRGDIARLVEEIETTEEINTAISEVAENLKVAGVNARIEAAKAGEHGPGFAAIADHLGRMIQTSSVDLGRSGRLLQSLRAQAQAIDEQAQRSLEQLRGNFSDLQATAQLFAEQEERITDAAGSVDRISESTRAQNQRISEIASAMASLDQAAAQFAPSAATLNSGTAELAQLQREMQALLAAK